MTKVVSSVALVALSLSIAACSTEGDSDTLALSSQLKPEGFLVVKDIVADASGDGFVISCAGSSGVKQTKYTRTEIEQNKICLSAPSQDPSPKDDPAAPPAGSSGDGSAGGTSYVVTLKQGTKIKARPNMNVEANASSLADGKDYCSLAANLTAKTACVLSLTEIRVSGVSITGCQIQSGYLYEPHITVAPKPPACE